MKIYTKEMFLIAAEKCEVSMIDAKHIMKYIDEYVTPIELPSDEEMEEQSWGYREVTKDMEIPPNKDWSNGAKWMKEQILNQNK
jgi:hypothetical protein